MAGVDEVDVMGPSARPWRRWALVGVAGVVALGLVAAGGAAYADARAQNDLRASERAASDAIDGCLVEAHTARAAAVNAGAAVAAAASVADAVSGELRAVREARDALRDAADEACVLSVTADTDANEAVADQARTESAELARLRADLASKQEALADAVAAAELARAEKLLDAAREDLDAAITTGKERLASLAGQVASQDTLDALGAAITAAEAVLEQQPEGSDVDALDAARTALTGVGDDIAAAVSAADASHQAWLDAQVPADAASGAGGQPARGGRTGGSSSGGGSTGGGSSGGGAAPGIVTWSACDGYKQDKFIDGAYVGGRSCATVASATSEVAPYQNHGNGVCGPNSSFTADSPHTLASKASHYTYARFSFTQVNDYQVKMTIETCQAP